jgi:hypothetical protein
VSAGSVALRRPRLVFGGLIRSPAFFNGALDIQGSAFQGDIAPLQAWQSQTKVCVARKNSETG